MTREKPKRPASWRAAFGAALLSSASPVPAIAQEGLELRRTIVEPVREMFLGPAQGEMVTFVLFLGTLVFAVTAGIALTRTRRRLAEATAAHEEALGETRARADRAESLLEVEQQVLVVWDAAGAEPGIRLQTGGSPALPRDRGDVLAFGKWLSPQAATKVEHLVERLRRRGEGFNVMVRTRVGDHVEVDGRTVGSRAVLRVRDLAGQRAELAEFHDRHRALDHEVRNLRATVEALPVAVWLRGRDGNVSYANAACLAAAGASSTQGVAGSQLFGHAMNEIARTRRDRGSAEARIVTRAEGGRKVYAAHEENTEDGVVGYAVDVTELEAAREERERQEKAHAWTLDKVTTAVAVFDAERRLVFHNKAFRDLWPLPESFLAERPGLGELLDRLRTARRLPEQANYREWQGKMLKGPGAVDGADGVPASDVWHLPDGQILQVVRSTNADGGITFLFEDLTRALDLETRFVALTHVQRETLESLAEAICVFGSDGRLKLHNPAFVTMWDLEPSELESEPHVETVIGWARALYDADEDWNRLRVAVTGLADQRRPVSLRMNRPDGMILDLRAAPLPDGAMLAVFTDMTDSARVERMLRDRNEALVAASRIKNEFVHKVSYELRAPLTNIIGFTQLMNDETTGTLNTRQREYADYILSSSSALLAIINDILDLATIDAGVLELELGDVDARQAAEAAAAGLADRLKEAQVALEFDMPADIGTFRADEKRVRQVLFNLLSNAVSFSEPGQTVRMSCHRDGGQVVFTTTDEGPGIPEEVRRVVFERFESHALGTGHRGAGLGLSLVKSIVELHGGHVELDSEEGNGTRVTCFFPVEPPERTSDAGERVSTLEPPRRALPQPAEAEGAASTAGARETY